MKLGGQVFREGWNGKDMFVCLLDLSNLTSSAYVIEPCLALKNARETIQPGWVPSQADMLAEDWKEDRPKYLGFHAGKRG